MRDLIIEYKYLIKRLKRENKELIEKKKRLTVDLQNASGKFISGNVDFNKIKDLESELALISEMVTQTNKIIEEREDDVYWMETGRRPGTKRGAERRSKEQRVILKEPDRFPYMTHQSKTEEELSVLEDQVFDILWDVLTNRERDFYTLAYAYGYSEDYIADLAKTTVNNVTKILWKARKKIEQNREKIEKRFNEISNSL